MKNLSFVQVQQLTGIYSQTDYEQLYVLVKHDGVPSNHYPVVINVLIKHEIVHDEITDHEHIM